LEDFKQFLPESAAQARAAAAAKAAEEANGGAVTGSGPPQSGPGSARLPAVGTFPPPPSVTKEKAAKKRGQPTQVQQDAKVDAAAARVTNKRAKTVHQKPTLEQQIASVEPSLTPFQPEPLGAPPAPMANTEELAFFDRVKKFIGNKQTYNEFLKLLNLFSQGLIDKAILVEKVHNFVGGNRELMDWFKRFVKWDAREDRIDNNPKLLNKVRLNVCRALGPSYRLLPKQVGISH
jgi:paired amphipathic helix protein Sin3a